MSIITNYRVYIICYLVVYIICFFDKYIQNIYIKEHYTTNEIKVGVVELSRIGRSIGFICNTVKELADLKIPIVLVNTNTTIDYNTLEGSAMVNALAMAADIEWRLIQDRNQRGRDKIKANNIKVGRKTLTEKKGLSMVAIQALADKGMSLRQIANELNCSAPTIMRYLSRYKDAHLSNVTETKEKLSNIT